MSFSNELKSQLARIELNDQCCKIAELAGLIKMDGTVLISEDGQVLLEIITENLHIARRCLNLIQDAFNVNTTILVKRSNRLKKNIFYIIRIPNQRQVTELLHVLGLENEGMIYHATIKPSFSQQDCCRKSYLRGVFLGAGYIADPQHNYHLEIVVKSEQYGEQLIELMEEVGIYPKMMVRNYQVVVYLKDIEQIILCLISIGTNQAVEELKLIKEQKHVRNQVNRSVNCETANLNKTIDASIRHIEQIKRIERAIGLENITISLREVARLRLEYPDLSLKELGEVMDPPLSKSAINHRMRRIEVIAEQLG